MPGLRVVLDTNVLVSGLAYPRSIPGRIIVAWQLGAFSVVVSRYILDETIRVPPTIRRLALNAQDAADLVDTLQFSAETVEPGEFMEIELRDQSDLPVLAALVKSQADYLITGDRDLLALSERYPIVTPAAFWEKHGE
jgi:uncharacterized protein